MYRRLSLFLLLLALAAAACSPSNPVPQKAPVYDLAGACVAVGLEDGPYLTARDGSFAFAAETLSSAAAFRLQPSDLGEYLLYDTERNYFAAKPGDHHGEWRLLRTKKKADIEIVAHQTFSNAAWAIERPRGESATYNLRHLRSGRYLGPAWLVDDEQAAPLRIVAQEGCVDYPELSLDAHGTPRRAPWPNGDVFGFADAHTHLFTNFGFGGGGIFHGAPFHPLGVEFALGDCEATHGPNGMNDIIGFFYTDRMIKPSQFPRVLVEGSVGEFNHATDGYPTFSAWPNPRDIPTHQAQYYRWLERAYMGGLRIIFQHATGNSALCEFVIGLGALEAPYGCNDMVSVDLQIDAAYAMERYIDARAGGPGLGWFRVVRSPDEARRVINDGKLAVVLGIEISNVFDCFLTPPPGMAPCTPELVKAEVQRYYDKGVRIVFPVHKFDNGFSAGDGHRGVIELGNVLNSGHYSSYTLDCPDIHPSFDKGPVTFGGLNKPRDAYFEHAPLNMSQLADDPIMTLLPIVPDLAGGKLEGEYCQAFGLTSLGRTLLDELMAHGMIIDVAHLPKRSVAETLDILDAHKYPAISTHGAKFDGKIYRHGGTGDTNLGRCGDPAHPGQMAKEFLDAAAAIHEANGLPAQPLAFDMNGFAGNPGPRFGPHGCGTPQANPITYPFESFDGGVTFEPPTLGVRKVDFNETGMIHIGLLPEYIEDARRDGAGGDTLEPLFHTAETLIRVWEAGERRSAALKTTAAE